MNSDKNGRVVRKVERRPVIHPRDPDDKGDMCDTGGPVSCEQVMTSNYPGHSTTRATWPTIILVTAPQGRHDKQSSWSQHHKAFMCDTGRTVSCEQMMTQERASDQEDGTPGGSPRTREQVMTNNDSDHSTTRPSYATPAWLLGIGNNKQLFWSQHHKGDIWDTGGPFSGEQVMPNDYPGHSTTKATSATPVGLCLANR